MPGKLINKDGLITTDSNLCSATEFVVSDAVVTVAQPLALQLDTGAAFITMSVADYSDSTMVQQAGTLLPGKALVLMPLKKYAVRISCMALDGSPLSARSLTRGANISWSGCDSGVIECFPTVVEASTPSAYDSQLTLSSAVVTSSRTVWAYGIAVLTSSATELSVSRTTWDGTQRPLGLTTSTSGGWANITFPSPERVDPMFPMVLSVVSQNPVVRCLDSSQETWDGIIGWSSLGHPRPVLALKFAEGCLESYESRAISESDAPPAWVINARMVANTCVTPTSVPLAYSSMTSTPSTTYEYVGLVGNVSSDPFLTDETTLTDIRTSPNTPRGVWVSSDGVHLIVRETCATSFTWHMDQPSLSEASAFLDARLALLVRTGLVSEYRILVTKGGTHTAPASSVPKTVAWPAAAGFSVAVLAVYATLRSKGV